MRILKIALSGLMGIRRYHDGKFLITKEWFEAEIEIEDTCMRLHGFPMSSPEGQAKVKGYLPSFEASLRVSLRMKWSEEFRSRLRKDQSLVAQLKHSRDWSETLEDFQYKIIDEYSDIPRPLILRLPKE